jgi:hypothetical protein
MRVKAIGVAMLVTGAMLLIGGWAAGQDNSQQKGAAPAMSPEEQAMMERMMKLATPGPQHALLAKTAGKWTIESHMAGMDPAAPPTTSVGTSDRQMLLGGRFLMEKVKSEVNGMPFEGIGILGYDNAQQKYISYWIDNMGTMMMTGTGTADATGKVITFISTYDDPMTGEKNATVREVLTIMNDDELRFEIFGMKEGQEVGMADMAYKRAK